METIEGVGGGGGGGRVGWGNGYGHIGIAENKAEGTYGCMWKHRQLMFPTSCQ